MDQLLLPVLGVLVVGAVGFAVALLLSGRDPGLQRVEPDGRAVPLPATRPLVEGDIDALRFDTVLRGYRMDQVDAALRRTGYDIGYKEELIQVLEAEVEALRDGRVEDADALRRARTAASRAVIVDPAPVIAGPAPVMADPAPVAADPAPVMADPAPVAPAAGAADEESADEESADAVHLGLGLDGTEFDGAERDDAWRRQETKLG
jgi:DivIVA domain-containing protein